MIRYTGDLGCRYRGIPHDLEILFENKKVKWERCHICNKKMRWNKGARGKIQNALYLKAHVRQFCQKFGLTKRVYMKIYRPESLIIKL